MFLILRFNLFYCVYLSICSFFYEVPRRAHAVLERGLGGGAALVQAGREGPHPGAFEFSHAYVSRERGWIYYR